MNKEQMIKRAYVRGLAARGIYRARLRQKQAAGGLKDYAISGGVGAAGGGALGSLIGALVQYARGKNVLRGAGIGGAAGAGAGLLGGLGYQFSKAEPIDRDKPIIVNTENGPVSLIDRDGNPTTLNTFGNQQAAKKRAKQWDLFNSKLNDFGNKVWNAAKEVNKQNQNTISKNRDTLFNLFNTGVGKVRNGISNLFEQNPLSGEEFEALWDAENGMSMSDSEFNDALNAQYNDAMSVLSKEPSNGKKERPKKERRYDSNDRKAWEKGVKENEDTGRGKMGY